MKKILYCILFLIAFQSCNVENGNIQDSFEIAMDGYYRENLRYPESAEEYCKRKYMVDSINGFPFISEIISVPEEEITFEKYCTLMRQACKRKDAPYIADFWHYLYANSDHLSFETTESSVMLYDKKNKRKYVTRNFEIPIRRFYEGKEDYDRIRDARIISNMGTFAELSFYTRDSLNVTYYLNQHQDYDSLVENLSEVEKKISGNSIHDGYQLNRYFLVYDKNGMISNYISDIPVPESYKNSTSLKGLFNAYMKNHQDVQFVKFYAYTYK